MDQLLDLISRYGLLFVFANVLIEQVGLPIPALPTLVLAGALAADGKLSAPLVLAVAVAASVIADYPWFLAGRRFGYRALRAVCRLSVSPESCVRQTEGIFERFGLMSLALAKFIPPYSTVAPPLAGIMGTRTAEFLLYNTAGATVGRARPSRVVSSSTARWIAWSPPSIAWVPGVSLSLYSGLPSTFSCAGPDSPSSSASCAWRASRSRISGACWSKGTTR